jgi:hypothetical protein
LAATSTHTSLGNRDVDTPTHSHAAAGHPMS